MDNIMCQKSATEQFFVRHQQWVIGCIVVPMSFFKQLFDSILNGIRSTFKQRSSQHIASHHEARVARVIKDVVRWNHLPVQSRPPIRTDRSSAASHSVRLVNKQGSYSVGMSDFRDILGIDLEKGTVTVEPYVTVGELTSYLLKFDRMLEATLEMEDATLGGLALSQGMTTHSHRCGLVHDTVVSYEFVSGKGERIKASASQNSDLFHCAGFSHGTLGFLTALEINIVPASKSLLVTYVQCSSINELQNNYQDAILNSDAFFLEAIVYSKEHAVLIRGDLLTPERHAKAQSQKVKTNHQGRWYKPWFFCHAQRVADGHQEYMPMRDYLMRHDRSMCMTMLYVFPAANHFLIRWLLGWMLPPKVTFLKALRPAHAREDVAKEQIYQDLAFPMEHLQEMVDYVDDQFSIYPLLVYPCKVIDRGGYLSVPKGQDLEGDSTLKYQYFLNLGIYGVPKAVVSGNRQYNVITRTRQLLAKVRSLGGFQHSYCDVFQTQEEFYQMFDRRLADSVRHSYGCESWLQVYEKVQPEIPWQQWSTGT